MRIPFRSCCFLFVITLVSMSLAIATGECEEAPAAAAAAFKTLTGDGAVASAETSGGCPDTTCNVSSYFCETYTGSLDLTPIGQVNLTLNITYNGSNVTDGGGGLGLLFPIFRRGNLYHQDQLGELHSHRRKRLQQLRSREQGIFITNAGFFIDPAKGTGTLAGATGNGNIVVSNNFGPATSLIHINENFLK